MRCTATRGVPVAAHPGACAGAAERAGQLEDMRTRAGVAESMKQYLAHKWAEARERSSLVYKVNMELRATLHDKDIRLRRAERLLTSLTRRMEVRADAVRNAADLMPRYASSTGQSVGSSWQ